MNFPKKNTQFKWVIWLYISGFLFINGTLYAQNLDPAVKYTIQNVARGTYLSNDGFLTDLSHLAHRSGINSPSEEWKISIPTSGKIIFSNVHSEKLVKPNSLDGGAYLVQSQPSIEEAKDSNKRYTFKLIALGKNQYKLQHVENNLFIGVKSDVSATDVRMVDDSPNVNVIWKIMPSNSTPQLENGGLYLIKNKATGEYLARSANNEYATVVKSSGDIKDAKLHWIFIHDEPNIDDLHVFKNRYENYYISAKENSEGSPLITQPPIFPSFNRGYFQVFHHSDGSYKILNKESRYYIGIPNSGKYITLLSYKTNSSNNVSWEFLPAPQNLPKKKWITKNENAIIQEIYFVDKEPYRDGGIGSAKVRLKFKDQPIVSGSIMATKSISPVNSVDINFENGNIANMDELNTPKLFSIKTHILNQTTMNLELAEYLLTYDEYPSTYRLLTTDKILVGTYSKDY